nr:50S ribosomal protein L28 [Bacteroidota bacterium]
MSKICDLTGKTSIGGNKVSFSNRKTKRRFNPNLQKKRFFIPETGQWITLKVSTSALRTIHKLGATSAIEKALRKGTL